MQNYKLLKIAVSYPDLAWEKIREKIWVRFKAIPPAKNCRIWAPVPTAVGINITHLCSLRCKMCGQWRRKDTYRKETLPIGRLKEILDEVAPFKPKIYVWEGEPLLYPDIVEFITYVKRKKLSLLLSTNGVLLERYAREIVTLGVDSVDISIDGPGELNDKIRGISGTFNKVIQGVTLINQIRHALRYKKPLLQMVCTISEMNYFYPGETVNLAMKSGLSARLIK